MAKQIPIAIVSVWVAKHIVPVSFFVGDFGAVFEMDAERVAEVALEAVDLVAEVAPARLLLIS